MVALCELGISLDDSRFVKSGHTLTENLLSFRQSNGGFFLIAQQIHFIGNYSLIIISVSGLFVGFVLGLQGYVTLVQFGSEQALGVVVALSLMRELGPVVTALLFAGRAGTSLTAEIGLMRAGEQLAAMEMMGVDPMRRIIVPRFVGSVISMPILAIIFSAIGYFLLLGLIPIMM